MRSEYVPRNIILREKNIVSQLIHAVTTTNSTADASSTSSTSASAVSTDSATNSSTTAVSAESTTGTTAVAAAAATATPTAACSKAQGLVGKLAGILGKRAPGEEGLEARMEQRVRRSRVFAGVRA